MILSAFFVAGLSIKGVAVRFKSYQINASQKAFLENQEKWKKRIQDSLTFDKLLTASNRISLVDALSSEKVNYHLSLDAQLQDYIDRYLKRYDFDWASMALMEPTTGKVLALNAYSQIEPTREFVLSSDILAASIFKIVTAAFAIENMDYSIHTPISYSGDVRYVSSRQIKNQKSRYQMSLSEAFAKSANLIFGKIGLKSNQNLSTTIDAFGFNQNIPFDVKMDQSIANLVHEDVPIARLAAGLGDVKMSALHGAMIASAIVNSGKMMEPYVVQSISSPSGETLFEREPKLFKTSMDPKASLKLEKMMLKTVTHGTAKKGFKKAQRDVVLSRLQMGGKTGSITNPKPKAWTEWFVGFAKDREKALAISIVILSEKKWKLKPSYMAKDVFRYYFQPMTAKTSRNENRYDG